MTPGSLTCLLGRSQVRGRLAWSFKDKLFFHGDATYPFNFTTAHGAHDSGQRAAD
jgi:monoamine oxidase